jgi:hypothetical protein
MTYGTYERLGVTVGNDDLTILRRARAVLTPEARRDPAFRDLRKGFYRQMLEHHRDAQHLVRTWRL